MSAVDREFTTMLMGIFMMENGKTTGGREKECILVQQPNSRYVVMKVDSFTTKEWVWLIEVNSFTP